jgi:hypothetical protein
MSGVDSQSVAASGSPDLTKAAEMTWAGLTWAGLGWARDKIDFAVVGHTNDALPPPKP